MKIVSLTTLYYPNLELLRLNAASLAEINITLLAYDNSEGLPQKEIERACTLIDNVVYVGGNGNVGLGKAYNDGLEIARSVHAATAVLLLDQDTDLANSELESLISGYANISEDSRLAIYGGIPRRTSGEHYKIKSAPEKSPWGRLRTSALVISSFSIIPISIWREVGSFREDFFIDHIDYDYCWKCRSKGFFTVVDPKSQFSHEVGEGDVILFGRKICPVSAPFRTYYQVRNCILSNKDNGMPLYRVIMELLKRLIVVLLIGLQHGELLNRLRFAGRGLIDGVQGKGGEMQEVNSV